MSLYTVVISNSSGSTKVAVFSSASTVEEAKKEVQKWVDDVYVSGTTFSIKLEHHIDWVYIRELSEYDQIKAFV